jgi:hypothetical protein
VTDDGSASAPLLYRDIPKVCTHKYQGVHVLAFDGDVWLYSFEREIFGTATESEISKRLYQFQKSRSLSGGDS